jgi:hypothetical protein
VEQNISYQQSLEKLNKPIFLYEKINLRKDLNKWSSNVITRMISELKYIELLSKNKSDINLTPLICKI